jgi:hypothetical protein
MAFSHEARTLLREPVDTDFRQLAGCISGCGGELLFIVWRRSSFDFADRCFVGRALDGLATFLGGGLGFAGLGGGDDLSVAGLEPEPVLAGEKEDGRSERIEGRLGSW